MVSLGRGLLIPPNSARILEHLGLSRVLQEDVALKDMQILDASGKLLYHRDQREVEQRYGRPLVGVARVRCKAVLAQSLSVGTILPRHRLDTCTSFRTLLDGLTQLELEPQQSITREDHLPFPGIRAQFGQVSV